MFSIDRVVGKSHLGGNGKLRLSAVVDFLQDCSGFHLEGLTELQNYFRENNIGMYLISRQVDILRLPEYGEIITLKTGTYDCKTTYGYRNTIVYDAESNICVKSYVIGVFVSLADGRPIKMPSEIIDGVHLIPKQEMEYTPRKISLPDVSPIKYDDIKIPSYLLDAYNHVNNARYIDLAEEYLSDDFNVSRIRMEYKKPIFSGDIITPYYYKADNKEVIVLSKNDDACSVVEFLGKKG